MNLQEMDREQMRMAILNQEHVFRQQVHELHRLYHVQKQLMQRSLPPAAPTPASRGLPAAVVAKPRPQQQQQHLDICCVDKAANFQQQQQQRIISFASYDDKATAAEAPALAEECNLELTLATGPSSSSSNSSTCGGGAGNKRRKAAVASKSDSGATAASSSSTSTDSELARFGEVDMATMPVRFRGEVGRRMDDMGQGPWMYQCLSLKTA